MSAAWTSELDERSVERLGELLALKVRAGDLVALHGDLGAGKTTLARALIRAMLGDLAAEVPSPTFSLCQVYATPRGTITHFDFYRLGQAQEVHELGFEEAAESGVVIVEWPERAAAYLGQSRFEISLADAAEASKRRVTVRGIGRCAVAARRLGQLMAFLEKQTAWAGAHITYLQGDASTRSYARLRDGEQAALLMDAPRQPDGPPVRGGKPYSQIAQLAEDVRPYVAIGSALAAVGLSVPEILAHDLERGVLLIEDFGDNSFGLAMGAGASQRELYCAALDVLLRLRNLPPPTLLSLPDGTVYRLPRRDRAAFEIEIELALEWLWPALKGGPAPDAIRAEYCALWSPVLDRLLALPGGWFLRDFHSPNLFWLPERKGIANIGIIDFQDALNEYAAFDLVSLLQDARVSVPETLEAELFDIYCTTVRAQEPGFDRIAFAAAYADFGAQRNTRLLGLWARLLNRDGKAQYVQHLPRTWGYLSRNLRNHRLSDIAAWYDRHFPPSLRTRLITA
jgi:tRNA threonylcarbamoyl adenosine modification protein YjeE